MKLLQIIGSVDRKGGGTTDHVYSCAQIWSRYGHECHVLCLDPPDAACVQESPLTTIALGNGGRLYDLAARLFPPLRYGYTSRLKSWLVENAASYDAIILNGLWNYTSLGTWRALRGSRVPYYVCPHGMLDPWLKKVAPARHFLRLLFWRLFERRVLNGARGVFFACEEEKRLAQYFLAGCNSSQYVIAYGTQDIPGDAEVQKSAFADRFPHLRGRKLILFLSRIHPKKGLDLLIKAFARLANDFPDFEVMIAGPDQVGLTAPLQKMVAELGVEKKVHWAGMLTGNEKWGALRTASFFVLPSHQENFGIVVAEAMALAIPVLITDKVNIWQEVRESGAGYVTSDDVEHVFAGLSYFCSLPEAELRAMGQKGRRCFIKRFNLEKNALEFIAKMGS